MQPRPSIKTLGEKLQPSQHAGRTSRRFPALEDCPNVNVPLRQCIGESLGHSLPHVLASSREANRIRQSTARPKVHAGCPLRWVFRPHRWGVISRLDFVSKTCDGEVGFTFRAYNDPPSAVKRDPVKRTAPKGQQRAAGRLRESRHKVDALGTQPSAA